MVVEMLVKMFLKMLLKNAGGTLGMFAKAVEMLIEMHPKNTGMFAFQHLDQNGGGNAQMLAFQHDMLGF